MKTHYIFLCLIFLTHLISAQGESKGKMQYHLIRKFKANTVITTCELYFNEQVSISYHTGLNVDNQDPRTVVQDINPQNRPFQVKNLKTKRILSSESAKIIVSDTLMPIKWIIKPEKKIIAGLECQKAHAFVRGRDYSAWFCPKIPINTGPWKLYGLPGLILEAYDSTGEITFSFQGLEYPMKNPMLLTNPTFKRSQKIISYNEYIEQRKKQIALEKRGLREMSPSGEIVISTERENGIEILPD